MKTKAKKSTNIISKSNHTDSDQLKKDEESYVNKFKTEIDYSNSFVNTNGLLNKNKRLF